MATPQSATLTAPRQRIQQRGGVESNERDVEDAVPYGVVRNVASSNTQHASEAKRAANEAPTLGNLALTTHQHTSATMCAVRAAETPGNAGLTDCDVHPRPSRATQPSPTVTVNRTHAGQPTVLNRQRPRSETAVGDEETKLKFRDDHL